MKEQVVTPRMSARGASSGKGRAGGIVQKPARRDRHATGSGRTRGGALRKALAYLPLAGKVMLAIVAGVLIFAGYRAAASASFFEARSIDVNPTTRADAEQIRNVVRRAASRTGVWQADLAAIGAELERLPWVRKAVVSRVLPDGLRVRLTERTPLAVVRNSAGQLVWVDEDAVTLNALAPTDEMPSFFIRGWDEAGKEAAREDNRERLRKYVELARDWGAAGLSERISEVDLADLQNVRVQLAGDDSQVEIRFLEDKNISGRLKIALDELDADRNTPCGPFINYLLVKPNNAVIVGTEPGKPRCGNGGASAAPAPAVADAEHPKTNTGAPEPDKPATRTKAAKEKTTRTEKEQRAKKQQDKKEEAKSKAKGDTRPRRVG